jgi:hypothetical protein
MFIYRLDNTDTESYMQKFRCNCLISNKGKRAEKSARLCVLFVNFLRQKPSAEVTFYGGFILSAGRKR